MSRNSRIILAKGIKLDREYKNVLDYSQNDMLSLLRSNDHLVRELVNCSFIRQHQSIKVDITYTQAITSNYIAFENPDYNSKWFFAWIDEVKWMGEKCVEITYTVDEWSTWSGNLTKKACLVEREHVQDDTLGAHTIDEGLELGDFIVNAHLRDSYNRGNQRIIVASNIDPSDGQKVYAGVYQGVASGFKYYSYPKTDARSN